MNITELARKLKITPKELKKELPKLGFHIGPRAIQIPDKQAEQVMEIWHEKKSKEKELEKAKEKVLKKSEKKPAAEIEKSVILPPSIQVYHLAEKLQLPLNKVMNELIKNGVLASVNENLDYEIAAIVAENLGFKVEKGEPEQEISSTLVKQKLKEVLAKEDKNKLQPRVPVVVVMGHVDHGKTALLSAIREVDMLKRETGGITQHIGAYQVAVPLKEEPPSRAKRGIPRPDKIGTRDDRASKRAITFIDTPGHEAFQSMRARGGEAADIAILVIAADDKVQPQTLESIKIIQQESLPFVVAINKIDKPDADVEKIKKGLADINLMPEDWGGKVITVPVSAKTKKGIEDLLEMVNLVAETVEKEKLTANPDGQIIATVIEAHLDMGFGPVASLILYNGTLKKGDNVIIGQSYGRLRSIKDYLGRSIEKAGPGLPVQIFGLKSVPRVGDVAEVVSDNREFKKRVKQIAKVLSKTDFIGPGHKQEVLIDKGAEKKQDRAKNLHLILRADVLGSLEAIVHSLEKLNLPEVEIKIIKKGLSNLTDSDVDLAKTADAWMIGFGVGMSSSARQLANELSLKVNIYNVIYDLIHDVKEEMNKLLPEEIIEEDLGRVEVLKIFQTKGNEIILGGRVIQGKIIKDVLARVWDPKEELKGGGKLKQLQINKRDTAEAKEGSECGIRFVGRVTIEIGDILEIYKEIKKKKKSI